MMNLPPKSEPPRKKSQMPKTSRQKLNPRGKILKRQKLPAKIRPPEEKTSNDKNLPPKSEPARKNPQMTKTSRQNPSPRGKNLK